MITHAAILRADLSHYDQTGGELGVAMSGRAAGTPESAHGTLDSIEVLSTSLSSAAERLFASARSSSPQAFRLVNSYTFALAQTYPAYHRLLSKGGMNLPDGKPLATALNILNNSPVRKFHQVRGPSFFEVCLDKGREASIRHFFLGGTSSTLELLEREATRRFPGIDVAGSYSPPFKALNEAEIRTQDERIKASGANVVWVGLGTPKQDFEAQRINDQLAVTTAGVGAAFDFLAGTKREAPKVVRQLSMEWAFRLATEPRRLWRRYLFGNARFLGLVAREFRDQ